MAERTSSSEGSSPAVHPARGGGGLGGAGAEGGRGGALATREATALADISGMPPGAEARAPIVCRERGGGSRGVDEGMRGEGPARWGAGQGGGRAASIPDIPLLTLSTLSKWAAASSVACCPQNILPPTVRTAWKWPPDPLPLSSSTKQKATRILRNYLRTY